MREASSSEQDDFKALGRALVAWFKSQDVRPDMAVNLMLSIIGTTLGNNAENDDAMYDLVSEAQTLLMHAAFNARRRQEMKRRERDKRC